MRRYPSSAVASVAGLALALTACGAAAQVTGSPGAGTPAAVNPVFTRACGAAGPEVLADAAGQVATRIYAGEVSSSETRADKQQVERYGPLLSAVAGGEGEAIKSAVTSLVYSGTHIVRLRVTKGSRVLADVGGPYILAPIGGSLRINGRTIAHYVLSVQDDLGYVKLESRFLGAPLVMRVGSFEPPLEGLTRPGPASIPTHGAVTYRHVVYQAFSFTGRSFPAGPLRISLLLPLPGSLARTTCPAIRSAELGRTAQLVSQRFLLGPSEFSNYLHLTETLTSGLLYIRAGNRQLAGTMRNAPARLPRSGTVVFRGRTYQVYSFSAPSSLGQVRIYQLT